MVQASSPEAEHDGRRRCRSRRPPRRLGAAGAAVPPAPTGEADEQRDRGDARRGVADSPMTGSRSRPSATDPNRPQFERMDVHQGAHPVYDRLRMGDRSDVRRASARHQVAGRDEGASRAAVDLASHQAMAGSPASRLACTPPQSSSAATTARGRDPSVPPARPLVPMRLAEVLRSRHPSVKRGCRRAVRTGLTGPLVGRCGPPGEPAGEPRYTARARTPSFVCAVPTTHDPAASAASLRPNGVGAHATRICPL